MKTIDFNFKVTDLAGTPIEDYIVKEQVANILASASTDKPIKSMEIARKIYADGKIELTSEDVLLLSNSIKTNNRITDLVKEQLLLAIEK